MEYTIDNRAEQLRRYIQRGWALVPLHDVSGGACSCDTDILCRSAGKHPRVKEWQRPENLVRDEGGLAAALTRWPSSNWGLATGLISGVWALDYDPKSVKAGEEHLVAAVLEACWASATWVQRTGSGGLHFVFALPEDFVPNNGPGTLPSGFDVRGARRGESGGGQIVIAPSVSGVGAYEVQADRPPAGAPGIVLEAVRPAAPKPRAAPVPLAVRDQGAVTGYVVAAVNGEVQKLASAPARRNDRAAATARRLLELINTGVVNAEAVYEAWWRAGKAHPDPGVTVPDVELLRVWASAERDIGDRPADLAHVGGPRGWGGDAIYPPSAPPAPDLGMWSAGGGAPSGGYPQGVHGGVDSGRTSADIAGQGPDSDAEARVLSLMAELLDVDALRAIVPPQPLINGVLDLDTTAWLIGESGSFKSFVALDLAAHVALGRPWRDHDVHQGDVVYIVAEGARGMKLRVDAWEREHGTLKGVWFLPRPVQANDRAAWGALVEVCHRLRPALVIIDTQARVTLGLEENSNTDMGEYIAAVDAVRRATAACVLTVHHIGRGGKNARGASALDGAQDAELKIERIENQPFAVKLIMDKQKDQAQAAPVTLYLRRSEGGTDAGTGRDLSSLVVDHNTAPVLGDGGPATKQDIGRRRALALFMCVYELLPHGGEGLTRADIKKLFNGLPEVAELNPAARHKAWVRAWAFLLERGRIMRRGNSDRFAVYPPKIADVDGMLTKNDGSPDEAPPDGWTPVVVNDDGDVPSDIVPVSTI